MRFILALLILASTAHADIPAQCKEVLKANDGEKRGFLWKESDHGGLVVLMPSKFKKRFRRVHVFRKGQRIAKLYYTGFANPDEGGDRQHWRFDQSLEEFPKRAVFVRAKLKKQVVCWKVKRPRKRND